MPTYEYECRSCGYRFEKFQAITANPLKTCPKCRRKVNRVIHAGSGIIFKGSGFYATDYRKASSPKSEPSASDAPCPSAGSKPACSCCPDGRT